VPVQKTFSTLGNLHVVLIIKCIFIRKMTSFKWSFMSISESTWLCVTSPKNAFCSVDRVPTCKVQFWGRVSFLKGQHRLRNSKTKKKKKRGREKKNKQTNRWYQIVILTVLETLLETQHLKASTIKLSRFFLSPLWYFVDLIYNLPHFHLKSTIFTSFDSVLLMFITYFFFIISDYFVLSSNSQRGRSFPFY